MPSNTPMTAAQLLKLADELLAASSECNAGILCGADEWNRLQLAEEAYGAARAASPVTLEEHLMAEEVRTKNELANRMLHFGAFTYEDRIEAERAHIEASRLRVEHARRLAGEGGA